MEIQKKTLRYRSGKQAAVKVDACAVIRNCYDDTNIFFEEYAVIIVVCGMLVIVLMPPYVAMIDACVCVI